MTLPQITLDNNEVIAYRKKDGGEQTILLVHGNFYSSLAWEELIGVLDPKYTVYAVDLRGFGESSYNHRVTQIKDFSDDLKDFVDKLGIGDFYMAGWSAGAQVCMQFEVDYPGHCKKLALINPASTRGLPMFEMNADGTPDFTKRQTTLEEIENDSSKQPGREEFIAFSEARIYTHKKRSPEKQEMYVEDMLKQRNIVDVAHSLNTFNIGSINNGVRDGTNQAKGITIPVLILRGDRDNIIPAQMIDEIKDDIGDNATYAQLTDTGHSPFVDNLPELKEQIEKFFI
ncbi:hypothetical protein Plano_1167 [Planococcus sp. PAMC 21323]|uniref:intracellular short-chain-length polyhydroxyalkanoate depolymerase n=1 Tax=Planococcus sp. PAMC 21323 TaxID=1526927 RepID=UPI00056E95C6|nr:alpha/beta hydrolase [Planococcus sp. PAMC 21323]AIY05132.1 hypothetical protein Plano_1167 [Planococcus sp. PAMC 21323]